MDLHSPKDKILLKNCIVVKLRQLNLEKDKPGADFSSIINEISYYENLRQILKMDDTETLILTLNNSIANENYIQFNKQVLHSSSKELAEEYIDLTKNLMLQHGIYSDEKFEELKNAFYKGNENLKEDENTLTESEKKSLANLDLLFKQNNPKKMSVEQFQHFSSQFKDSIKALGISKFQHFFDKEGKKIVDMQISYDTSEKPVYKTDFSLLDCHNMPSHQFVNAPASASGFTANYYQTLCHTYLEAANASKDESNIIVEKMNSFSSLYKKLKEQTKHVQVNISNHSIVYSGNSNILPSKELPDLSTPTGADKEERIP